MIKCPLLICILICLSSCSFFSKKVESLIDSQNDENILLATTPIKNIKRDLYCLDNNKLQLLFEDESTQKYYQPLLTTLFNSSKFSFIQKASMLTLIEMIRRPDEASPAARLQYFLRYNNKNYYYDFRPKLLEDNKKMPYLKGIDVLIKNFDSSKSLITLANTLDQVLPANTNISPDMEEFLLAYKDEIIKNDVLAESFLKGDEVLTKHETFKKINLKKFISEFYTQKNSNDSFYEYSKNTLFDVDSGADLKLKCNVDINKENTLKEDFIFSDQKKSHYFAIKDGNNFFVAVSSAILQRPLKNYSSTYFMKARSTPTPLPICQFNNTNQDMILFSTKGRNPAQHLKHLISYDINLVDSYSSLEELLKFSRHLFLTNPDRILYESKRGRKSQLDFFLTMNFPIYHVDLLGDIIGFAAFKSGLYETKSLIMDDRSQSRLWCEP